MSAITPRSCGLTARHQAGAALLVVLAILLLVAAAVLLERLQVAAIPAPARDPESMRSLARAKSALIAWAASHPDTPGLLPFPDRDDDVPPSYDGEADCVSPGAIVATHLLGKLPIRGEQSGCTSAIELFPETVDSARERLWYAVSRNLVRGGGGGPINPDIGELATQPWITVRDQSGAVISDRVAAVILAPGPVLGTQDRGGAAPKALNFLDALTVGASTYSNFDADGCPDAGSCATPGEDFIVVPGGADGFNDRLVFITVDELMRAVEDRVLGEAGIALRSYRGSHPDDFYPWLSPFSDPRSPAGPATGGGATSLVDTGTDFGAAGVLAGHVVRNLTDGSIGPVASVSATTLTLEGLVGGTSNSFAAGDRYVVHAPDKFRGIPGTVEGMLPLHYPNELFATGFTADWDLDDIDDYYESGDSSLWANNSEFRQKTVTFSDVEGTCMWTHKDRVDCYGIQVTDLGGTPFVVPSGYSVTRRTIEVQFSFEGRNDTTPTAAAITAPTAASPRTRSVEIRATCSKPRSWNNCQSDGTENSPPMPDPSRFGAATPPELNPAPFLPQDRDATPGDNETWIVRITDENGANVGQRAVVIDHDTRGRMTLSGIRYEIDVTNELARWFVDNDWHRFVHAAVAGAHVPALAGTSSGDGSCTSPPVGPGNEADDCLIIQYNAATVRNDVEALVIAPGAVLAAQDRTTATGPTACAGQPPFLCDYFEAPNSDAEATARNLVFGRALGNTFDVDTTFNDQIRAVPP